MRTFLGIDIGTSSSKGVLADESGALVRTAQQSHHVTRPAPGHVEMDPEIWWDEFCALVAELTTDLAEPPAAIGISGMGPCVVVADSDGVPLRPAILYGIDTRATDQIKRLTDRYGAAEILERCGSLLTTQAVGPKLAWLHENEAEAAEASRRLFMPSSWLSFRLTGRYSLDFHSASQCTPLFDRHALAWFTPWAHDIAPHLELPELVWPGEILGLTQPGLDGIPEGIPVVAGTIDAWAEALSAGAHNVGDLLLMYGTTMFLIATSDHLTPSPKLWGTVGALPGTWNLAGGLATSGAITSWLRDLAGSPDYPTLIAEAESAGVGAHGLLILPYFAGERTPIMDPDARGVVAGLTLSHGRGELYRATLEATAFAVKHNLAAMHEAGVEPDRIIAVGGGTQGRLWTQIVSDVTGLTQTIPSVTVGAAYGMAWLAARSQGDADITTWNPPKERVLPDPAAEKPYSELYELYGDLRRSTEHIAHALAARQRA